MTIKEPKNPSRLPLDLLETFVCLAVHEGDASAALNELDISQPTMSKRLSTLRRFSSKTKSEPWFRLQGKRWHLTGEGRRVFPLVSGLVRQYRETESFLTTPAVNHKPLVSIACGQTNSRGLVSTASQQFLKNQSHTRIRIATPRARLRIEGVATGLYDMAIVSDSPENVFRIAGKKLHIIELYTEELVLFGSPNKTSEWGSLWSKLPKRRAITAEEIVDLPFILPEPDASTRKRVDNWFVKSVGRLPHVVVETGGWHSILGFANAGHGVCVMPAEVLSPSQRRQSRKLGDRNEPRTIKIIANKARKADKPDLQGVKLGFFESLVSASTDG